MYKVRHKNYKRVLVFLGAAVLGLGASGASMAASPGVSSNSITMGAILSLTGVFASGAKAQLAGMQIYWNKVNKNGGVCKGRTVKIIARDHHYNVQKAVTAYSGIHDQILAIQGLTGTPMSKALAPRMASEDVVAVPMSFSPVLLGQESLLVPGSTYDVNMANGVDYLVKKGMLKKGDTIGYVYFPGGYGGAGLKGAQFAAKQHGITVMPFQVTPHVSDLSSQIHQMVSAGADAIFMSASPPLLANAAAVSHTAGLDVPIVVPAPNFVPELLKSSAAAQIAARVMVVGAYNAWDAKVPAMKELRALYAKSDKSASPQQFLILGYVAADIMHHAIDSVCAKGDLTRKSLKQAFTQIESFNLHGLAVNVSYRHRSMPPSLKTYILKAKKGVTGGLVALTKQPFEGTSVPAYVKSNYK